MATPDADDTTVATPGVGDTTTATDGAGADDRALIRTLLADRQAMQESLNTLVRLVQRTHTADGDPAGRTNPKDPKLTKFSESTDDIEAYLTTFERLMTAHNVDTARWAYMLAPQLTGKAQQAFAAMPSTSSGSYDQVKTAILRRYDISEETYRQRFRGASCKEGESYRELAVRLSDLLDKWMKEYKADPQQVLEQIATEQLLSKLPRSVQIYVRERKPKSVSEAGEMADDYVRARRPITDEKKPQPKLEEPIRCQYCDKKGHSAKECWKAGAARPTGQSERTGLKPWPVTEKTDPTVETSTVRRKDKRYKCHACNEVGHFAANCPSKPTMYTDSHSPNEWVGDPSRAIHMFKVASVTRSGEVEGIPVDDMTLDTGSARTIINSKLVSDSTEITGEIPIRCAHGDIQIYPLAQVEVRLGERCFMVEAAVSKTLPLSVLLGRDVPELLDMLNDPDPTDVMAVMTRAQSKKHQQEIKRLEESDRLSGASPNTLSGEPTSSQPVSLETKDSDPQSSVEEPTGDAPPFNFDAELFVPKTPRVRKSRQAKRDERQAHQRRQVNDVQSLSKIELRQLQENDETLAPVRRSLKRPEEAQRGDFYEEDGLIYRKWIPRGRDSEMAVEQLVLPKECRSSVLMMAHSIPLSGHLGRKKTGDRVLQRFYWPTLFQDVAAKCKTCPECQKTASRPKVIAPLIPLPIVDVPFERIAMDIVGPLPRSRSGNKYVLVICDYASRYPEAVPLRSIDASHVAEELLKFFSRVGIPKEVLTDQGSNFMSKLLSETYRMLGVKPIRTTPYHPQTDGLVERFNQTLKAMLRRAATESGKDWDKLIPFLLFAYREVPQSSTGFSPFELVFGRHVRGPLDILKEAWEGDSKTPESVASYLISMHERLSKMTELVRDNMAKAQDTQKQWYDRHARSRSFKVGDQVLVLLPTSSNRLLAQWHGPYPVTKTHSQVTYEVDMLDKHKRCRVFHVNMLRKWNPPTPLSLWADNDEDHFEHATSWNDNSGDNKPLISKRLTKQQQRELSDLLANFSDVLSDLPGKTDVVQHRITLKEKKAIRQPPYRLAHAYRELVQKEIKEMLAAGIVEPSNSEWASPIVLVRKKDGSMRFCVDYRKLNSASEADAYPMPRVDELIDTLGRAKFISTLDLTRGYWQVPVEPNSRPFTAFTTPFGLYQFTVMPFGLHGAPATFQRLMDRILVGQEAHAAAYIDDVVIQSNTWEDHLTHLRLVLESIRLAGLTVKARKCQLAMEECVYLGHVVGNGVVRPEISKVAAVQSFKQPTTKKEVRIFLGLTGYYRKFIPNYASVSAPLSDLTRRNRPNQVEWSTLCEESFVRLKQLLCTDPILQSPDFTKQFTVQTDASDRGVGAVLSQPDDSGQDHPVAYFSKKLLPREEHYSTIEKECLAIKLAVQAFRVYLLGRPFVIQTDHRALEWLDKLRENNSRLTRWSLALQPFVFQVKYRCGKLNGNADSLSRYIDAT